MGVIDRVRPIGRWLAARSPRQLLIAGWVGAMLLCYPGYLPFDTIEQLGQVRSGVYSDAYAPVMSFVWSLCEWVFAGPFLMLALQTGLFAIGAYGIARRVLAPRPAAIVAIGVLVAPPVFAPMAVIWPDALAVAALLAAFAAFLDERPRVRNAGVVALVLACGCKPELAGAVVPIALFAFPRLRAARRVLVAVVIAMACAGTAHIATSLLVDRDDHARQQRLEWADLIGVIRRVHDQTAALDGLPIVDRAKLETGGKGSYNSYALTHGAERVADPITSDSEAAALAAAWRREIADHPGAYVSHRLHMFVRQLAIGGTTNAVVDDFGNPGHLVMLHHRATPSDLEVGWRAIVRALAKTPLFWPWIYAALAIAVLVVARRRRELVALVASGLIYELTLLPFAPSVDYRFSLLLVATTWLAVATWACARRPAWLRA